MAVVEADTVVEAVVEVGVGASQAPMRRLWVEVDAGKYLPYRPQLRLSTSRHDIRYGNFSACPLSSSQVFLLSRCRLGSVHARPSCDWRLALASTSLLDLI